MLLDFLSIPIWVQEVKNDCTEPNLGSGSENDCTEPNLGSGSENDCTEPNLGSGSEK
jgi:hypothetical protein